MIYTVSTFHDDSPYLNCELAMERVLVMTHGVQQRCSRCRLRPCWQSTEDDTNGAFHLFILTWRCKQKAEPARLCSAGQRAQLRSRSLLSGVKSLSRTSSQQVLFFSHFHFVGRSASLFMRACTKKASCFFTRERFCKQNYSLRSESPIMAGGAMQRQSGKMQRVHKREEKVRMVRAISSCPFCNIGKLTLSWEERETLPRPE